MILARTEEEDAWWREELTKARASAVPLAADDACAYFAYTASLLCAFKVVPKHGEWSGAFRLEYRISGCRLVLMVGYSGKPPAEVRISRQTFDVLAADWHARMDAA